MKLEDGEIIEHAGTENNVKDADVEGADIVNQSDKKPSNLQQTGWSRRDGNQKAAKMVKLILSLGSLNDIDLRL